MSWKLVTGIPLLLEFTWDSKSINCYTTHNTKCTMPINYCYVVHVDVLEKRLLLVEATLYVGIGVVPDDTAPHLLLYP